MNMGIRGNLFHSKPFWSTATLDGVDDYIKNWNGDVHSRDETGKTPLHYAAESCFTCLEAIALVLERGADVHARDEVGNTPLHLAAQKNFPEVVELLLDHHADGMAFNGDQKTAFDFARENQHLKGSNAYWRLNDAKFRRIENLPVKN